eukprot:TRINITY_DN2862_c1_g1_i2.p1 TRINITY_DN2862_c1_g1~~TRINITY_DN2862_c1_g1_i2.p1  ORF type:complete len:431 (-),score=191.25 TRINITY_DN2862_c1_g1_i2:1273-2565(-)
MLDLVGLPKNVNGFRTTHTCELCGFEPKTKNKYREKQDHLVMKHFKEKIDKIFPHCRPYACPSGTCAFTGKDKQALLRHYTGKHGILDKYLREALAEKGINYSHDYSKRKHSSGSQGAAAKQARLSPQPASTSSVPTTLFLPAPSESSSSSSSIVLQSRPNTEELKKEVEAMMATFQPVEPSQVVLFSSSSSGASPPNENISNNHHIPLTNQSPPQEPVSSSSIPTSAPHPLRMPPSSPLQTSASLHSQVHCILPDSPPAEETGCIAASEGLNLEAITLPALLASSPKAPPLVLNPTHHPSTPRVLQQIQQSPSDKMPLPSIRTIVSQSNGSSCLLESSSSSIHGLSLDAPLPLCSNVGEVMWGGGGHGLTTAVVLDTHQVAYIETADGSYTPASIDQIDDYLYAHTTSSNALLTAATDGRERQLDFCML